MHDESCLFCRIAAKTISSKIVYEDEYVVAFLDVAPRVPGHTVVVSKYHTSTLLDLPDEEVTRLFCAVKTVDVLLSKKLNVDGMTIGINQGAASGQEVGHLHIHLLPRWDGDNGGSVQSIVHNPAKESIEELFKTILQ